MYKSIIVSLCLLTVCACRPSSEHLFTRLDVPAIPVLAQKDVNKVATLTVVNNGLDAFTLESIEVYLSGSQNVTDITNVSVYCNGEKMTEQGINAKKGARTARALTTVDLPVSKDSITFEIGLTLKDTIEMSNKLSIEQIKLHTTDGNLIVLPAEDVALRVGIALRKEMQDGVHTSRIPGLTTTKKGTLVAMYDARWEGERDLQGDIDLCINRSTDGGRTWSAMQKVQDMGQWGGLPEKYNGVSDGCILVDDNTGDIYVAGLWMYGIIDPVTGKWVEGLDENSTLWNHQWRSFGSQPGYDVKQSSQFIISKSTDDGLTWSQPVNITRQVKPENWWLMAPAPGHGITLDDGTLVFPAEGRTETGKQISTIIYSKDSGQTWASGTPAYTNTNECMAVQLSYGCIMLNMRERSNRGLEVGNGRAIAVTTDLGQTWVEHPTSRNALIESACMAALHKHIYTDATGKTQELLFFFNPSSKTSRNNFTLKCSIDQGETWPEELWLPIDMGEGNGYSCITSIDNNTLGILYEGSGANLVFLTVSIDEIL